MGATDAARRGRTSLQCPRLAEELAKWEPQAIVPPVRAAASASPSLDASSRRHAAPPTDETDLACLWEPLTPILACVDPTPVSSREVAEVPGEVAQSGQLPRGDTVVSREEPPEEGVEKVTDESGDASRARTRSRAKRQNGKVRESCGKTDVGRKLSAEGGRGQDLAEGSEPQEVKCAGVKDKTAQGKETHKLPEVTPAQDKPWYTQLWEALKQDFADAVAEAEGRLPPQMPPDATPAPAVAGALTGASASGLQEGLAPAGPRTQQFLEGEGGTEGREDDGDDDELEGTSLGRVGSILILVFLVLSLVAGLLL